MQRVTIKDIASVTKMSQGTVHRALHGKKGVSEEVRQSILKVAKDLGYTPNYVASSLKRKALNVIVFLPSKTGKNKYFYLPIWNGIDQAFSLYKDYNINYIPLAYEHDSNDKEIILKKFLETTDLEVNGIITQSKEGESDEIIKDLIKKGIPTAVLVDDLDNTDRLCFVGSNYFVAGELCAELLSSQIEENKDILVFCGNPSQQSHRLTVQGMEEYILENNLNYRLIKVYDNKDKNETIEFVKNEINNNTNLKAIYSVNAKNTVLICEILKSVNYKNNLRVVGSDIFKESVEFMEDGYLNNILHKNPRGQSYKASKILIDYIIKNEKPNKSTILTNTEIVFKSNLNYYRQF